MLISTSVASFISLVPRLHPSRNFVPTGSLVSNLTWGRDRWLVCVGTINALDPTCPRTCVAFVTVLLSEAIKVCSITFGMATEPSDESKWLKSHYEEAATGDVPTPRDHRGRAVYYTHAH